MSNSQKTPDIVRPISRLAAVELTDNEIEAVAGGACKVYTESCTVDRHGYPVDPGGCNTKCDDSPKTDGGFFSPNEFGGGA
jgi:hypothetical protein